MIGNFSGGTKIVLGCSGVGCWISCAAGGACGSFAFSILSLDTVNYNYKITATLTLSFVFVDPALQISEKILLLDTN